MTSIRVRLDGELKDMSMIASLTSTNSGEPFGVDRRWNCDDPPSTHVDATHPILRLTTKNAINAAQVNYDIQGIAHLSITNSSELAPYDLVVDIRRGLTTHFYATFVMSHEEIQSPLVSLESDLIDQAIRELSQINLSTEECIIQTVIPGERYLNEIKEIAHRYEHAAATVTDDVAVIMLDDAQSRKIVVITRSGYRNFTDDSVWYKYWQCRAAYRELLSQASELSDQISPLLDRANNIPVSYKSSKKIAIQLLEMRASIVDTTDTLRSFTLMMHTLRKFRDQLIFDKSVTAGYVTSPFRGELLWEKILREEQRLYIQPLETVETAIGQLINSAESRLSGLEGIQQAAFDYQIQRQLRAMQAIAIIIAIVGVCGSIL